MDTKLSKNTHENENITMSRVLWVVTESVFNLPGLGRLVVEAVLARDYPVIQGLILLFSFTYILINLLVDILYTVFDPRIRY